MLDPQLLACTPIKPDPLISPRHVSQLCCFGHVNGFQLTQVKWNVNAEFGLCWNRNLFCLCSSKITLRSSRIATLTKKQQKYCTYFAREIPRFTRRIPAPRVGNVGNRPRQVSGLKLVPRPCGSLHISCIHFRITILYTCTQFSLTLYTLFLPDIAFK